MSYHLAALNQVVASGKAFRILPAGAFSSNDGRPGDGRSWMLSADRGQAIAALAAQRSNDFVIDYEHQTLKPGQKNPAAGWFKALEMRPDGLYVTDPRWTDEAKSLIQAQQYRYISPVFSYHPETLEVMSLHSLALTNNPALLGLTDLSRVALTDQSSADGCFAALDAQTRDLLERMTGMPLEQAAAEQQARGQVPPAPQGIIEEDWRKLYHVLGDSLLAEGTI